MNRPLVLGGAALVIIGAVMLVLLFTQGTTPVAPATGPVVDPSLQTTNPPSRLWAIVIGLVVAAGAGMIGIGMNRWRRADLPR
jgi:hypothetical protein